MKYLRLPLIALVSIALSAVTAQAAQLASAKVLSTTGTVTKYLADGSDTPLQAGDILVQGDSVVTTALSEAELVFSNGSTLTLEENTSLTFKQLEQAAFGGSKSYEQLAGDPSKSQTLLELNYGVIDGHVKKLKSGSSFDIETPLGTAAIRGTQFKIELRYNPVTGEFLLFVTNKDGKVDITSRYQGTFEFGRGTVGDKNYDSNVSNDSTEPVPPTHTIIIRINKDDPNYENIINYLKNLPPTFFLEDSNPRDGDDDSSDGDSDDREEDVTIIISPSGPFFDLDDDSGDE